MKIQIKRYINLSDVSNQLPMVSQKRDFQLRKPGTEHSKHLSLISHLLVFGLGFLVLVCLFACFVVLVVWFCLCFFLIYFQQMWEYYREKSTKCNIIFLLYAEIMTFFCRLCQQTDSGGREDDIWNRRNPVAAYNIFAGKFWSYLKHQEGFTQNLLHHFLSLILQSDRTCVGYCHWNGFNIPTVFPSFKLQASGLHVKDTIII